MDNHGLILKHIRKLSGLSLHATAKKIGKSVGWLSEIENGKGLARITEREFQRIVECLDATKHRPMFRTWVANFKNRERVNKTFDGAVFKYIRKKQGYTLTNAAKVLGISKGQLSKIESGLKIIEVSERGKIMQAYGYTPSSFKNLATDPVRSKVVPSNFKLQILLKNLTDEQIETVFGFVQELVSQKAA